MSRNVVIIAISAILLLAGCTKKGDEVVKRPGQPDYVRVQDKKLMERAIQKARATQQEFVQALQNQRPEMSAFSIKKAFPAPEQEEHIWLDHVVWDGKTFEGYVNNEPVATKAVKQGDRVRVTPEELSDWMYLDGGVLKGGYTIRVLHSQSSPEEQKELSKHIPFSVPPVDF